MEQMRAEQAAKGEKPVVEESTTKPKIDETLSKNVEYADKKLEQQANKNAELQKQLEENE